MSPHSNQTEACWQCSWFKSDIPPYVLRNRQILESPVVLNRIEGRGYCEFHHQLLEPRRNCGHKEK